MNIEFFINYCKKKKIYIYIFTMTTKIMLSVLQCLFLAGRSYISFKLLESQIQ